MSLALHYWMGDVHHCSGLRAPVSEMTYTVSSGTLNSSIPYHTFEWPGLNWIDLRKNKPAKQKPVGRRRGRHPRITVPPRMCCRAKFRCSSCSRPWSYTQHKLCRVTSPAATTSSQSQRVFVVVWAAATAMRGVAAASASVARRWSRQLGRHGAARTAPAAAGVVARPVPPGDLPRRGRPGPLLGAVGHQRTCAAAGRHGACLDVRSDTGTDHSYAPARLSVVVDQSSSHHQVLPLPYVWTG